MLGNHRSTNSQWGAHMGLQSWMIKSWPIIDWFPPSPEDEWPSFLHMSTQMRQERRGTEPCVGSTVWVGSLDGVYAGLAWEWVELRTGVLMLADPNSIITNIQVVGVGRQAMDTLDATVRLNVILHRLPWQDLVGEVLASAREGFTSGAAALDAPDFAREAAVAIRAA